MSKKLTIPQAQELAEELYERTKDFVNNEVIEMLYDEEMIEELDDEACGIINRIIEQYWAHHITKHW